MLFPQQSGPSGSAGGKPLFGGLRIASQGTRLETAVIGLAGCWPGAPVELYEARSVEVPHRNDLSARDFWEKNLALPTDSTACVRHTPVLTTFAADNDCGPGSWNSSEIAQWTGLTILDGHDKPGSTWLGQGSPLLAFLHWILVGVPGRDTLLIDLGYGAKMSFLPANDVDSPHDRMELGDVFPCGCLLDALTRRATGGRQDRDDGGRLAVQGRKIPDVVTLLRGAFREWMARAVTTDSRWHLDEATEFLVHRLYSDGRRATWSDVDILCSAADWIAGELVRQLSPLLERRGTLNLLVRGRAARHALLMCHLSRSLLPGRLQSLVDCHLPDDDTLDAVATALWGALVAWRAPSQLACWNSWVGGFPPPRFIPGNESAWSTFLDFQQSLVG